MEQILQSYYANNGRKLHAVVDKILKKFGGISQKDYDDFYSIANNILADISVKGDYDETKGDFGGYFYTKLYRDIQDEVTARNRQKRRADKEAISIYSPLGEDDEDGTLVDIIGSDYSIEKELDKSGVMKDEKVEIYLNSLSKTTRKVIEMKMSDYSVDEIKNNLNLTNKDYDRCMKEAKRSEYISQFSKNVNDGNYKRTEVTEMELNIDDEMIMDLECADNYRMDKFSLYSLLEAINEGEINRKYILQRKQFQWAPKQVNKYLSRILNNQPIPEIVICEQKIKDILIKWLIDGLQRLSYAEAFKEGRIKIGEVGTEFPLIKYKEFLKDENGNRITDEYGVPQYEIKVFNIIGKKYSDLPEFLKKRFNNFNINVTTFFNCTSEQIAYHIRNYNNHVAMSKTQYGITSFDEDVARNVKALSDGHAFFKDCGNFTDSNISKGEIDRVVVESLMAIRFMDNWKKAADTAFEYINENATSADFDVLRGYLNRLEKVIEKDKKSVFNATNSFIWFAAFDRFTKYGLSDEKFGEFVKAFSDGLCDKEINGASYSNLNKKRNTKDKSLIVEKINKIEELMLDYLHIDKVDTLDSFEIHDERIKKFVQDFGDSEYIKAFELSNTDSDRAALTYLAIDGSNKDCMSDAEVQEFINDEAGAVDSGKLEDTLLSLEILNDWSLEVDNTSDIFNKKYIPVLLTVVDTIIKDEVDDVAKEWFIEFVKSFNKEKTFGSSYNDNCIAALYSLNQFLELMNKESA